MKVHFFLRTLNERTGGGSHFNAIAYVRALRSRGHTVVVHALHSGANEPPSDIELVEHQGRGLGLLGGRRYLAALLRQYESQADSFFLYAAEFMWGGGLYRRTGGEVPVAVYIDAYLSSMRIVHTDSFAMWSYQFKRLLWDKTVGLRDARHVDHLLATSPFVMDTYVRFGFPKDRFSVLPNIVPPFPGASISRQIGEDLRILYVGRLIYDKGIDLLVQTLGELKQFKTKLVVVGDGEMRAALERDAKRFAVPLELHGWVPQRQLGDFYRTSDIFVHPARWPDPAPRTVVDAVACGVPAVVPRDGGSSWIAGSAGIAFDNGDGKSLRLALEKLLSNPDLRRSLGAHGPAEAQRFSEAVVAPLLEKFLLNAIQSARV